MSILLCMGTRPEVIKLAPVYHALRANGMAVQVLHTGQHDSLARPLYQLFDIPVHHAPPLARDGCALAGLGATLLQLIDQVLEQAQPRAVVVQGDTSTALMGALAAFYRRLPVAHVEAGLRTHDPHLPFPEEVNRCLIARLARWHFAPTERARANLLREGIAPDRVAVVGNTVVDAVRQIANRDGREAPDWTGAGGPLVLVTAHRREHWGAGVAAIASALIHLLGVAPSLRALWPVHANPELASGVRAELAKAPAEVLARLHVCDPLPYASLVAVLQRCWLVLTDSGGLQEEAATLHKPVLVLRASTERNELIESGGGLLVGTERHAIVSAVRALLAQPERYRRMCAAPNPFGDGQAAGRVAQLLAQALP